MEPKSLKLSYFDISGRCEQIRIAFAYGGIQFEDDRISREEFAKIKSSYPLKQVPVLYVDGKPVAQSNAIFRYAGKLSGLYPRDDDFKSAQIDMICDTLSEIVDKMIYIVFEMDGEELKSEETKNFFGEFIPNRFNALLKYQPGKFILGDEPSLADIKLYDTVAYVSLRMPSFDIKEYPDVEKIIARVRNLSQLANYSGSN